MIRPKKPTLKELKDKVKQRFLDLLPGYTSAETDITDVEGWCEAVARYCATLCRLHPYRNANEAILDAYRTYIYRINKGARRIARGA